MTTTVLPASDDVRLSEYLAGLLARARASSRRLVSADRDGALDSIADGLLADAATVLAANAADVEAERLRGTAQAQVFVGDAEAVARLLKYSPTQILTAKYAVITSQSTVESRILCLLENASSLQVQCWVHIYPMMGDRQQ